MKSHNLFLTILFSCFLSGCAFENKPLSRFDPNYGYRLANLHTNILNTDDVFIVLTFSGGGTRAAAFAYGALQELSTNYISYGGNKRRLIDEVDIISSVSGGSFTAAYYALYRDDIFVNFERDFLTKNVEQSLFFCALDPINWPRLASPYFDRIDLAAEYYDKLLFKHHTYGDLLKNGSRPLILLNATDMSLEAQFQFTQEQFDLLYSTLNSYPLSRAVAASSAFPFLLSPLTLKNYYHKPDFVEPIWVEDALQNNIGLDYEAAKKAKSYEDTTNRPYIHLLDGGLSDNIGFRGPSFSLLSNDSENSLLNKINQNQIKKLVFIAINAKPGSATKWDTKRRAPGLFGMFEDVTSVPMDAYSIDTVDSIYDESREFQQEIDTMNEATKLLKEHGVTVPPLPNRSIDFYPIEIDFDKETDPAVRKRLKSLPTNYDLSKQDVELLEQTAREELQTNAIFQKLLRDLR